MTKVKYIVFDDNGLEDIIIFSELQQHGNIALRLGLTPVSAGFIQLSSKSVYCYGDSLSLGLKSRPVDTEIAERALNYP